MAFRNSTGIRRDEMHSRQPDLRRMWRSARRCGAANTSSASAGGREEQEGLEAARAARASTSVPARRRQVRGHAITVAV